MKKIYVSPKTTEVMIDMCHMVCASEGTLDKNRTIDGETVQFGSRRGSFWDDDEDDEY